MNIGILKERKKDERRVALRPDQAHVLIRLGHRVFVERGAGSSAGFPDSHYAPSIVVDREELYDECTLLLKVKSPEPHEYHMLRDKHVLFCYLHFDENLPPSNIRQIIQTGVTGIAYEWVEKDGQFPLLQPMSELSGSLYALKAMSFLMEHKGIIGATYSNVKKSPIAAVIGIGNIGRNAVAAFIRNGFDLVIVDKHPETLDKRICLRISPGEWQNTKARARIIPMDEGNPDNCINELRKYLPQVDILICAAVRRTTFPKTKCEYLIDRSSVTLMQPRSVICDATACDQDLIETAVSSASLTEYYFEGGILHYNCDHIPSLACQTATQLLTDATFPYILELASGFSSAVQADKALYRGVMCYRGTLTHEYSAAKKSLSWQRLVNLL